MPRDVIQTMHELTQDMLFTVENVEKVSLCSAHNLLSSYLLDVPGELRIGKSIFNDMPA